MSGKRFEGYSTIQIIGLNIRLRPLKRVFEKLRFRDEPASVDGRLNLGNIAAFLNSSD